MTGHYNIQTADNNFQSLRDYSGPRAPIAFIPQNQIQQLQPPQAAAAASMNPANVEQNQTIPHSNSGGMLVSDYKCLTCGGPILDNTTSTTTCVKCARLRTRRRAFAHPWDSHEQQLMQQRQQLQHQNSQNQFQHLPSSESMGSERLRGPHDSRDSGVSSGSSQDYGDCTPTTEKSLIFPSRYSVGNRVSLDRQSVQFSQLVRKLSEVEGIVPNIVMKSSIDEGVCIEEPSSKQLVDDPNATDLYSVHSNQDGSWRHTHQLSQGSTFDSVSLGRSMSIASPGTEQIPYQYPSEHNVESSSYAKANLQQVIYPPTQSGSSCGDFPSEGNSSGAPLNSDLTASLPSCTHGGAIIPCAHYTETPVHGQMAVGVGHQSTITNTAADIDASTDISGTLDPNKINYCPQQQQYQLPQQQYKFASPYSQHLTPGAKRFFPQAHHPQQKQNLLNVCYAAHPIAYNLSPRRVRSPICFREGRRASDGYVGTCSPFNNTIAFPQKLYDKGKAGGHIELNEVREEHRALQNQFGSGNKQNLVSDPNSAAQAGGQNDPGIRCDTPPDLAHQGRLSAAKRISLPENFAYFSSTSGLVASTSTSSNTLAGNIPINVHDPYGASILYQQQMIQHRMRPVTGSGRRTSGRPNSYGYYPPQSHQQGLSSDFLFQPIAEDEADGVPMSPHEHSILEGVKEMSPSSVGDEESHMCVPSMLPLTKLCLPSKSNREQNQITMDEDRKDPNWQELTNDMEISCRLTESTTTREDVDQPDFDCNDQNTKIPPFDDQSAATISLEIVDPNDFSQDQLDTVAEDCSPSDNMDTSHAQKLE